MIMRKTLRLLFLLVGMTSVSDALRADSTDTFTPAEFTGEKAQIIKDLNDGVRYMEISKPDKQAVLEALARIQAVLSPLPANDPVDAPTLTSIRDDKSLVETLLAKAARDSTMKCRISASTGSNMLRRRCQSYAKYIQRLEEDQRGMERARSRFSPVPRLGNGQ